MRILKGYVTPEEAAYAAGIIDGEGCITTVAPGRTVPQLVLAAAMTDARVPAWLKDRFGGGFSLCAARPGLRGKPRKPTYRWAVVSRTAEHVLRQVLPYLKTKRQQAERGLALRALAGYRGRGAITSEIRAEGARLRLEISNLNRTGAA